jgi:hypothetical protein
MKHILSLSALLLTTVLYISSCNPIDEEELNSATSSNSPDLQQMSPQEALQAIQGEWYCYKRESVDGPTCAGGPNETKSMYTFDLQYAGYKVEFTNDYHAIDPTFGFETYEMYYNGGNGTTGYTIRDSEFGTLFWWNMDMGPNDLYLWFYVIFMEGYGYELGGRIVSLTNNELVLYTMAAFPTLVYFKRSNQTAAPYNLLALNGNYALDGYKDVSSGVTVTEESIQNSVVYNFTNEIYYDENGKRVKYTGYRTGAAWNNIELDLDYYDSDDKFSYEVSDTHIFSEGTYRRSYKVHLLNSTELVLRRHLNCNTYQEYHFTKLN